MKTSQIKMYLPKVNFSEPPKRRTILKYPIGMYIPIKLPNLSQTRIRPLKYPIGMYIPRINFSELTKAITDLKIADFIPSGDTLQKKLAWAEGVVGWIEKFFKVKI